MSKRPAKVLYTYTADDDAQLSITAGESITVTGEVTSEGWILATNQKGQEGYIPDQYFEITVPGRPKKPPPTSPHKNGPPARPVTKSGNDIYGKSKEENGNTTTDGSTNDLEGGNGELGAPPNKSSAKPSWVKNNNNNSGSKQNFNNDDTILGQNEIYNLYTYHLEWFGVAIFLLASIYIYIYSTTQPNAVELVWPGLCACIIATCNLAYQAFWRELFDARIRGIYYLIVGVGLCAFYPIGPIAGGLFVVISICNFYVYKLSCKAIPTSESWYNILTNNFDACGPGKTVVTTVYIIFTLLVFVFGFVNGKNYAQQVSDDLTGYLSVSAWGVTEGFGTIISINFALIILFSCYGFQDKWTKYIRDNKTENKWYNKVLLYLFDKERRNFLHRLFNNFIVMASFLHIISNYYSWEASGPTHSYVEIFGMQSIVTGYMLVLLLCIVLAGSNEVIYKQNTQLFHKIHYLSFLLVIVCIFHGKIANRHFYIYILAPLVLFGVDYIFRCGQAN